MSAGTRPAGETYTFAAWGNWIDDCLDRLQGLWESLDQMAAQIGADDGDQAQIEAIHIWQGEIEGVIASGHQMVDQVNATQRPVGEAVAAAGGSENTPHKQYADETRSGGGYVLPSPVPMGEQSMDTTYTTAHRRACPQHNPSQVAIWPDGLSPWPTCPECQTLMEVTGSLLTGSWRVRDRCCRPAGPDGTWAGPPRDVYRCDHCCGTHMDVMCTVCYAGGCDGVHDFCVECDGSKRVTCTADGCYGGTVELPSREVTCRECRGKGCGDCEETGRVTESKEADCPACKGSGEVKCPACKGTGKPPGRAK